MNSTDAQTFALVTGASRGIGKHIAVKLLRQGAEVIGTANNSEFPDVLNNHNKFSGLKLDLADLEQIKSIIKPVFQNKKVPNVLINNAGIDEDCDLDNADDVWLENWSRTLNINLRAPALLSKWAAYSWKEEGIHGRLINIASRAAYRGDTQEYASYAASKGGLVSFTKSLARDLGTLGISAYSIAPGFVDTDMARESVKVYGKEYLTQGMAFDEITPPEQVAELAAFLATGNVSHMTGSTFHINGGSYMI